MKRGNSKQALTFVDIYRKRLQKVRSSISANFLTSRELMNLSTCKQELTNFSNSLEFDPGSSLGKLKTILNTLPKQLYESFMTWTNSRELDALQLCVVYDRSDIILVLLENAEIYPDDYRPKMNPYAHLAAMLGHKDCLEALLVHRPGFYFKTSKPQHALKLHKDIQSRLRMKEGTTSVNRYVQRMLKKVGEGSMKSETTFDNALHLTGATHTGEIDILDKEMTAFKEPPPSLRRRRRRFPSVSFEASDMDSDKRLGASAMLGRDLIGNIGPCGHFLKRREHVITVHLDCFADEPDGVVKGAGLAVKVARPEEVRPDQLPKLPILEDVRVLSQRSRLLVQRHTEIPTQAVTQKSKMKLDKFSSFNLSRFDNASNNAFPSSSKSPKAFRSRAVSNTSLFKKVELGVRTIKKYKDFQVVIDSRVLKFRDEKYMNKTPLTLAAEKGHLDCVKYLLQKFLLKQHPMLTSQEPLTLATRARSPEAIAILLTGKRSREDLQSAILTALRDFYPACLTVLLSTDNKERSQLFGGENLFHVLYSQSLNAAYRYEMMPEMTRTLITCKEDVNARSSGSPHPLYTLISCAFHIRAGKQCLYYLECLKILLAAKANPHYNELKDERLGLRSRMTISRELHYSAIHCVFASANRSTNFFEKPYWAKIIMQKFIDCIVTNDKTPRRVLNDVLFWYMDHVSQLGLDRKILRSLLRYGANPDYKFESKYAVNKFFEEMLPFLTQFEVTSQTTSMLDAVMFLCHSMSPECLHEAFVIFLDDNLLRTPLQALSLTRRFCYEVNKDVKSPRLLTKLTANFIWKQIKRNSVSARKLLVSDSIMDLIIPSYY